MIKITDELLAQMLLEAERTINAHGLCGDCPAKNKAKQIKALVERVKQLTGNCKTCSAPLGPMGCGGCDVELCACCVVYHDCDNCE